MKKILLHLFYLLAFQIVSYNCSYAQTTTFCGFEWTDESNAYAIEENSLVNAGETSPSTIYTTLSSPSTISSYHFETTINTNLSNNNQIRYYLQAASAELTDGICIRIGTNTRNITLVKGTQVVIKGDEILGKDKYPYNVSVTVDRTADKDGNTTYSLRASVTGNDGAEQTTSGTATIKATSLPQANYMGIMSTYSKESTGKFIVTDISVSHTAKPEEEKPDEPEKPITEILPDSIIAFSGFKWHNSSQSYNLNSDNHLTVERGSSPAVATTSISKGDSIESWTIRARISTNLSSANQLRFHILSDKEELSNSLWLRIGTNARNISLMRGEKTVMMHSDTILHADKHPYDITATVSRTRYSSDAWQFKVSAAIATSSATLSYTDSITVAESVIPHGAYMGIDTRFSKTSMGKYLIMSVDTTMMHPEAEEPVLPDEPDVPETPNTEILPDTVLTFCGRDWKNASQAFKLIGDSTLVNYRGTSPSIITTTTVDTIGTWDIHATISSNLSSANQLRLYLISDNIDFKNAIWLRIGTNNRNISLMRGTNVSMLKSDTLFVPDHSPYEIEAKVARRRLTDNNWRFTVKANAVFRDYSLAYEDSIDVSEKVVPTDKYMAIEAIYSKTNAGKYVINEFSTQKILQDISSDTTQIIPDEPDIPERPLTPTSTIRGDVVINELMVNPSGLLGLPRCEYIELYNITDSTIVVTGWTLQVGTTKSRISQCSIQPHGYALLCSNSSLIHLQTLGNVVGVTPAPTLTNSGGRVILRDNNGHVIDFADYSSSIYDNTFKKDGGWSLERIDPYNLSNDLSNWAPSNNSMGGTPLMDNSVADTYVDTTAPYIRSAQLSDDGTTIDIEFSEPIDSTTIVSPLKLNGVSSSFSIISVDEVAMSHYKFRLSEPLMRGTVYSISSVIATDLAGNELSKVDNIRIAIPYIATNATIIISEIMAEASPSSLDYIEFYNYGSDSYDMRDLYFGIFSDDKLTTSYPLTSYPRIFFPGDYIVLCGDSLTHIERYSPINPHLVIGNSHFGNLQPKGTVTLCLADGTILDKLNYSTSMHSSMIADTRNVALERILTKSATDNAANWTSASYMNSYATPTSVNSQNRDDATLASTSQFTLKQRRFTPDGDGVDDEVVVYVNLGDGLWTVTMRIFSADGILIATPCDNRPMPVSGELTWNGHHADGSLLSPGTYIIYISAFSEDGRTITYKHTCLLTITQN